MAVFSGREHGRRYVNAYLRDYNEQWPGCCIHHVAAKNGRDAKRIAIRQHNDVCPDLSEREEGESRRKRQAASNLENI